MSNMTPETLRAAAKAIDDYEGCARMYNRGTGESLDLYELADAWEEGRKDALTLYNLALDEIAALRKRLEEAEEYRFLLEETVNYLSPDRSKAEMNLRQRVLAALAGEEKR